MVSFDLGTGIRNPVSMGEFHLAVKTSSERTYINSPPFTIFDGNTLTISDVSLIPDRANAAATYKIEFNTGAKSAIVANHDTVSLIFERNTGLPDMIVPSDVLVNVGGYSDYAADVWIYNRQNTNEDTICFMMPIDAEVLTNIMIKIDERAGILNPSEMGRYKISILSNHQTEKSSSNPYFVNQSETKIGKAHVTPDSLSLNVASAYGIGFSVGANGRLMPGRSSINLSFSDEFKFSPSVAAFDSISLSISNRNPIFINSEKVLIDYERKLIKIQIPDSMTIENEDYVYLKIGGAGIRPIVNPSQTDTYFIALSTSVEAAPVSSQLFTVGGTSVTIDELILSNSIVNNPSAFTFNLTTQTALKQSDADYIQVTFPQSTKLPEAISSSDISINGVEARSVSIVQSTKTVTVTVPQFIIVAGESLSIRISEDAGILNPDIPSETAYRANLRTSKDITPVRTSPYSISGGHTRVSISDVLVEPAVKNMKNVTYDIRLVTSSMGRISGGVLDNTGTITIDFDTVTFVPPAMNAGHIRINDRLSSDIQVLKAGTGGRVRVSLPKDLEIKNNSPVQIYFESAAGLATRDFFGDFCIGIRTSSDTVLTKTNGEYLIEELKSLVVNSVEASSYLQNANSAYSVRITTGSEGKLAEGDSIHLVFPTSTILPAAVNKQDIVINGYNLKELPPITGNILSVPVPFTIERMSPIRLLINKGAGIHNPILSGTYALKVATTSERDFLISPIYRIKQTSSTVSNISFTAEPVTVGMNAVYKVSFKTGSNGRLLSGVSTVTLTFDEQTLLSQSISDYDSSFIFVKNSLSPIPKENFAISGPVLTFIIPRTILIDNDDQVTVFLQGKSSSGPIRNPQKAGTYRIQVKTSVEKHDITSGPLNISAVPPVANVNAKILPNMVNAKISASVSFKVQREINKSDGTITITFPRHTLVPSLIQPFNIRIAHGKQNPDNFSPVSTIITNQAERTLTVTSPSTINRGDMVKIEIDSNAGFDNPSIPGNYSLKVRTNSQEVDGRSAIYTLKPADTEIVNLSVNIVPNTPGAYSRVSYSFTTGSRGRLISGESNISLVLPGDNVFTQGVPAPSKVTVNGVSAHSLKLISKSRQSADTLIVTIPNSVTIGNETDVTIVIDSTSGLKNASTTATLTYATFTSVETKIQGDHYSLPVQLTNFTSESKSGYIVLEWLTESKLEEAQWMIERKEISQIDYESIQNGQKNIESMGNSFEILSYLKSNKSMDIQTRYVFVDSLVQLGAVYAYRLSDVNDNGRVNHHGVLYQDVTPASEFLLLRNIPNPFNSSTKIRFYLPEEAEVDLKIYDLVGQVIRSLADDVVKSGLHEIAWNASNRNGSPVASGMYVVSFRAKGIRTEKEYTQLMKILLVR